MNADFNFGIIKNGMFYEGRTDESGNQVFSETGIPSTIIPTLPKPIEEETLIWENWAATAKWARLGTYIKKLALQFDCTAEISVDKGWIRETTFFKLTGKASNIRQAQTQFGNDIEAWQNR